MLEVLYLVSRAATSGPGRNPTLKLRQIQAHAEAKLFCCAVTSGPASGNSRMTGRRVGWHNIRLRIVCDEGVLVTEVGPRLEGWWEL